MGIAMFGLSGGAMALLAVGAYMFIPSVRRAVGGILRKPAHLGLAVLLILVFSGGLGGFALSNVNGAPAPTLSKDADISIARVEYSLGYSQCGTFQTKVGEPEHLELRCTVQQDYSNTSGEARFNMTITRAEASNAAVLHVWTSSEFYRNQSNAAQTTQYNMQAYGTDGSYSTTVGASTTGQALYGTTPYVKTIGFAEGDTSETVEVIVQLSSDAVGALVAQNSKNIVLNFGKEPGVPIASRNINVARSS